MRTPITFRTDMLPPTEMWVDAHTWRGYEAQGFELVGYEPPPAWLAGCWGGRARIRMKGGPEAYTWSPELAALHTFACESMGRHTPSYFTAGLRVSPASKEWNKLHHKLFDDKPEGLDWHRTLIHERPGEFMEDVQVRLVAALRSLAAEAKTHGAQDAWTRVAGELGAFRYERRPS